MSFDNSSSITKVTFLGDENETRLPHSIRSQLPLALSNSPGPMRSISSLKAHRGPYSRPSVLDKDSRYSPYAKKPMLVLAKKVASENPNLRLTSTAERIIHTLANYSTPVVDVKKSPIDSLKSLRPEFPVVRRDRSGPPIVRSAFDTTPNRKIISPPGHRHVSMSIKSRDDLSVRNFIDEIFSSSKSVGVEEEFSNEKKDNLEDRNESSEENKELFEDSGIIKSERLKFEGWSVDKFNSNNNNNMEESSESSSEDEDGNPYIKMGELKKQTPMEESSKETEVVLATVDGPPVSVLSQKSKWECPSCMVQADADAPACPCCETPNPNSKQETCMNSTKFAAINKEPTPINPSQFTFGFKSGTSPSTVSTVKSSFKFGEQPKESTPNTLFTNFKQGFNHLASEMSNEKSEESAKPVFPVQFSFGFPGAKSDILPETKKVDDKFSHKTQSGVIDFAKKSANEEVWECPTCMVFNKISQSKCECCGESQPKSKPQVDNSVSNPEANEFAASTFIKPSLTPTIPIISAGSLISVQPVSTTETKRKVVYGLRPDDEDSLESSTTESSTPNPFQGFTFPNSTNLTKSSGESQTTKPMNEMWTCTLCKTLNKGGTERCTCCQQIKPRFLDKSALSKPTVSGFEKYIFQSSYKSDSDNNDGKPEVSTVSGLNSEVPLPQISANPALMLGANTGLPFRSLNTSIPSTSTPFVGASPGFQFGSPSTGDGLKRKADEASEKGSTTAAGFNFTGSSEPKLKLRASGVETPIPVPSLGLKSGSVMDALKQPGFGSVDKPDNPGVVGPVTATPTSAPRSFAFPSNTSNTSTQAHLPQTPGLFQFGSTSINPPSTTPGFGFVTSTPTNTSTSIFGSGSSGLIPQPQPQVQGGFRFEQPGIPAPIQHTQPFAPNNFSMTPNLNFGALPSFDNQQPNQPFTFQSQPSPGGASAPRRIRKAVRRNR